MAVVHSIFQRNVIPALHKTGSKFLFLSCFFFFLKLGIFAFWFLLLSLPMQGKEPRSQAVRAFLEFVLAV